MGLGQRDGIAGPGRGTQEGEGLGDTASSVG